MFVSVLPGGTIMCFPSYFKPQILTGSDNKKHRLSISCISLTQTLSPVFVAVSLSPSLRKLHDGHNANSMHPCLLSNQSKPGGGHLQDIVIAVARDVLTHWAEYGLGIFRALAISLWLYCRLEFHLLRTGSVLNTMSFQKQPIIISR